MAPESRYTFQEKTHGAGGFGKVIRGHDQYLDRDIAVKILDPLATQFGEGEQERFKREARILAKLSHPNIPAVYDVIFDPPNFYIITEFIEGINLKVLIEDDGPCSVTDARLWINQGVITESGV